MCRVGYLTAPKWHLVSERHLREEDGARRTVVVGSAALAARWRVPPRLYVQRVGGIEQPLGRRGRRYWIVSRGLCRFFKVPLLAGTAGAQQADAVTLQIKRLSPFEETGSHCHFGTDFVTLWLWDQRAVRSAAETVGVDLRRLPVLPEPALRPTAADGVRLVATVDGVEAQSWHNANLAASRWWPSPPDESAWMLFQRGAAVRPERMQAMVPSPVPLEWLHRPWTKSRVPGSFDLGRIDLRLAAAGIGAAVFIAYGYLGGEWLRLGHDAGRVETEIAARSRAVDPTLRARTEALEDEATIKRLRALDPFPQQLALMALVSGILPKNETHLTDWVYDKGQLEMTVAANHPLDALYFVRSLQRIDGFKDVVAESAGGDNSLVIRLAIEPR